MKNLVKSCRVSFYFLFSVILLIPSVYAKTRNAIPAGRYEALSGVAKSYGAQKSDPMIGSKDSQGFFWSAVTKHMLKNQNENFYYSIGLIDKSLQAFFSSNGILEAKILDNRVSLLLSDNFVRDHEVFKKMKIKGGLIVLRDKHNLQDIQATLNRYNLIIYQEEVDKNYFLLQLK